MWVCVLMPVLLLLLLRWRGSPPLGDRVGGGNVGSRLSQRERDRGGLMNQRAMGEKGVISLQDLGDAMRVSVCGV